MNLHNITHGKNILFLLLAALFFTTAMAQQPDMPSTPPPGAPAGGFPGPGMGGFEGKGNIICTVLDESNRPLEYATITVLKPTDSSMVAGGITNEKGVVNISDVPYGTYIVKIGFIGYKSIYINDVTVSREKSTNNIGKQKINTNTRQLKEVKVTAEKEMIQTNLDKRVFNVDKNIVTEGATGTDILENVPSVSVDLDGNVSLRGSTSVTILVDGRPTNLTMDEIPADMIESIEVVTNPSARYEPDGISGIINVVLKKKKTRGFNVSANISGGISDDNKHVYFNKYNAGLNLNFRMNKVNIFASYNYFHWGMHNTSDMIRTNVFDHDTTLLQQHSVGTGGGGPHNVRAGLDYYINDYNSISFEFGYNRRAHSHQNEITSLTTNTLNDTTSCYSQQSLSPGTPSNGFNGSFNYTHTSPTVKGRELTVDMFFSSHDRYDEGNTDKHYYFPMEHAYYEGNLTDAGMLMANGQVDFVTPIGNGSRLETGYKIRFKHDVNDYTYYIGASKEKRSIDSARNESSIYTDVVNAAYLIYSNSILTKFKYQVGVRFELANNISQLEKATISSDSSKYTATYFNVFPTVHLRYDFNDIHSLQLGYSMRVGRPRGMQLNPFLNDMDKLNLRQGNRELKPEFTHSVDLGYLFCYKKSTVSANVFYRYRYDIISQYTTLINDSTTYTSFQNLHSSHSYGVEISYQQGLWKFWNMNINASLFQTIVNDSIYDASLRNDLSWRIRWNNTFVLPLDFSIQLSANYRSKTITLNSMGFESGGAGQGIMNPRWNVDLGIKKSFLNKTLSLSLQVRDIFNSQQTHVKSYGTSNRAYYESVMDQRRDSRSVSLTLTYSFSNYKMKQKKRREVDDESGDDMMF